MFGEGPERNTRGRVWSPEKLSAVMRIRKHYSECLR